MNTILQMLKILCLIVLLTILVQIALIVRLMQSPLLETIPKINQTLESASQTLQHVDIAAQSIDQIASTFNQAAGAEIKQLNATTAQLEKTEAASRAAIDSLRQDFIDVHLTLMPKAVSVLDNVNRSVDRLQPTLDNLSVASKAASERFSGPEIQEVMQNLDASSKNLADGTKSLSGVAQDAKELADYEKNQLEKPAKLWLTVLKTVLGIGSQGRTLFFGNH